VAEQALLQVSHRACGFVCIFSTNKSARPANVLAVRGLFQKARGRFFNFFGAGCVCCASPSVLVVSLSGYFFQFSGQSVVALIAKWSVGLLVIVQAK